MGLARLPACVGTALVTAAMATTAAAQPLAPLPFRHGEIAIKVRVNHAPDITARVNADSATFTGDSLANARGAAVARTAEVHTGFSPIDGRVRHILGADQHPWIRFELLSVTPGTTHGDTTAVTYDGRFTIKGQTRDVTIPGAVVVTADSLVASAVFPLDIRDYGITPPTAFFGIIRARPVVRVSVRLVFAVEKGRG